MSAVCVLTPVVIAAWPALSAAIVSAAQTLGYTLVEHVDEAMAAEAVAEPARRVNLEIQHSEVVTDTLARGRRVTVTRDGIQITFSKDPRGRAALCVSGDGHSEEELRQAGEELSRRVVQKYVHQRLMEEMKKRHFVVVDEHTLEDETIHLKVRHWEN